MWSRSDLARVAAISTKVTLNTQHIGQSSHLSMNEPTLLESSKDLRFLVVGMSKTLPEVRLNPVRRGRGVGDLRPQRATKRCRGEKLPLPAEARCGALGDPVGPLRLGPTRQPNGGMRPGAARRAE